jgi:integrase
VSPLDRRPYDLRHTCLSTWLNGGVYPTQVAEWAGHSVDVLLRIYAEPSAAVELIMRRPLLDLVTRSSRSGPLICGSKEWG